MGKINEKDIKILKELRKNARESLTRMSRKVKIPISTIFDRMSHHQGHLIRKYTCLLDFNELGYHSHATIILRPSPDDKKGITAFLTEHPNVNTLRTLLFDQMLLVDVIFEQANMVDDFMDDLREKFTITKEDVFYTSKEIKAEAFFMPR